MPTGGGGRQGPSLTQVGQAVGNPVEGSDAMNGVRMEGVGRAVWRERC